MTTTRFKVATFNLFNLVLPEVTYYGDQKYSQAVYQRKKLWISRQLEALASDIVGFQEVFHGAALREILDETPAYRQHTLLVANETGTGPVVAMASKLPVLSHEVIADFPKGARLSINSKRLPFSAFSRPVLHATVEVQTSQGQQPVELFVVHLKSKRPLLDPGVDPNDPLQITLGSARSLIMRAAEAHALRHLLVKAMRGNTVPVVVLGDFNDNASAVTSEMLAGSPPFRWLSAGKKAMIWDVVLSNVKDLQAQVSYEDVYYTHIYNGHHESLDHIFVSNEFLRANPRRVGYVEYVKVLNDHLIDETLSSEGVPKFRSDHGQVAATIRMAPQGDSPGLVADEEQEPFTQWDNAWDEQYD